MIIHPLEKKIILASTLITVAFGVLLLYAAFQQKIDVPDCVPFSKEYLEPGIHKIDEKNYKAVVVSSMWQFAPQQMSVPTGSEVEFFITSKDVVHGFHIAPKNVNLMALYGQVVTYRTKFDKPGVYKIVCHEYCGVGHQSMLSEIIVNDPR